MDQFRICGFTCIKDGDNVLVCDDLNDCTQSIRDWIEPLDWAADHGHKTIEAIQFNYPKYSVLIRSGRIGRVMNNCNLIALDRFPAEMILGAHEDGKLTLDDAAVSQLKLAAEIAA